MLARLTGCFTLILLGASAFAADPPASDTLPPPRAVPVVTTPVMPVTGYYRTSKYAVWQYYDVTRDNQWRPRVIYAPHGAYYLGTGQPYYWPDVHPLSWSLTIIGQ
jgi:hypothetical protein